jgi:HPt (histidine-containing phosphotransfer) domain-containing protein
VTSAGLKSEEYFQVAKFSAEMEGHLARLREKFLASLVERVLAFEEMKRVLRSDRNSATALQTIYDLAHKISGVAATLGFADVGALSSEMEHRISGGRAKANSVDDIFCDTLPVLEDLLDEMERLLGS